MNNLPSLPKAALSRRKFLGTTLAGTVATLGGAASMSFFSTEPALAQSNLSPRRCPQGAARRQRALCFRPPH
jgi:secreted PhoX family phosphatase